MNDAQQPVEYDAVIVGAGFAGMFMLHRLRECGLSVRVFEAGGDVGGTWYWNRYPGARCDVESMEYSYQFSEELQQEWQWSERYATQPEILDYASHVADRFGLRSDIQFDTRVASAHYNEATNCWQIETETGDLVSARFCIMATGCLSSTNTPEFDGMQDFKGPLYHTGKWPHEGIDFTGKTVGIIGTGSSAIQSIPIIAEQADELWVFQRTANYSVPAHNRALDPAEVSSVKADYANFRAMNYAMPAGFGATKPHHDGMAMDATEAERDARFETRWELGGLGFMGSFEDLMLNPEANELAAEWTRGKIRGIVEDPITAELLSPRQTIGCKRLCVDTDYYATYNRDNVHLVDVSDTPVDRFTETGIEVAAQEYPLDCIILATGFDAMTGALLSIDIRGREGLSLQDKWAAGPLTYLGLSVHGFPNLFTICGPGSPSVLSNMIPSIEQHVNWIADAIAHVNNSGLLAIESEAQAETDWVAYVNSIANMTLYPTCNSWYLGANVPGKPRVFMPHLGLPSYIEKCEDVVQKGYDGFRLY